MPGRASSPAANGLRVKPVHLARPYTPTHTRGRNERLGVTEHLLSVSVCRPDARSVGCSEAHAAARGEANRKSREWDCVKNFVAHGYLVF